LSDLS